MHHIPVNAFNENQSNIIERYNCSDDDDAADSVGVKRVSTGKYLVRFENNKAKVAAVTTEHSRYKASVMRISADNDPHVVFQVETRSVTKSDDGEFKDSRFHILIG